MAADKENNGKIYTEVIRKENVIIIEKYLPDFYQLFQKYNKNSSDKTAENFWGTRDVFFKLLQCAHNPCNKHLFFLGIFKQGVEIFFLSKYN